jgi:4a-hydroxytetrahydrobiopterin dehydratase
MDEALASRRCVPCRRGMPALTHEQIAYLLQRLEGWAVEDDRMLVKTYRFPDFAAGLAFVNRAGAIAEAEGHHPDLHLAWGRVGVELSTHVIGGLSENDFILAAKLDEALSEANRAVGS